MARVRCYIKPFDGNGNYESSFTEITKDVDDAAFSDFRTQIDSNDFSFGVSKNSNIRLTLRNEHGKYSEVGKLNTIFRTKREDSQVKITWDRANHRPICGHMVCGKSALSNETTVFVGLLQDKGVTQEVTNHKLTFTLVGRETLFSKVLVPFSSISNGQNASAIILSCLNQSKITEVLNVDVSNINLKIDPVIDDVSSFENQTVKEALDRLLFYSNSVLFIDGNDVIVKGRVTSSDELNLYNLASEDGRENVVDIREIRSGHNRIFNFITWEDTTLKAQDVTTVDTFGVVKKEIGDDMITNSSTKQTILDSIRDEFGDPKEEFIVSTPLTYDAIRLPILGKLSVDAPTPIFARDDNFPIYEISEYGVAKYPGELFDFEVLGADEYKVMGKSIDLKNEVVEFKARLT